MRITILCVGKVREAFYREAAAEYLKRLGRYVKIAVREVADEKTPDGAGEAASRQIREREGERLLRLIPDGAFVIALAIEGESMDSVTFSRKLAERMVSGTSHIVFVIGGSLGLSDSVLVRADRKLSFSAMTFPHQLMRVILLEQIYRAFRIQNGEPYHK